MSEKPQAAPEETTPRPDRLKKYKDFAARFWNPPQDKLLVRSLVGLFFYGLIMTGATSYSFFKFLTRSDHATEVASEHDLDEAEESHEVAADAHGAEAAGAHGGEAEASEGESQVQLGASPFPKSILRRKTGKLAEGHDIIEPEVEITRNVASLIKDDLKVSVGTRIVAISDVTANPKTGALNEGTVRIDLAVEVGSNEAREEIEARRTEIRALVGSIGSSYKKERLRTTAGMLAYKLEIQKQLNLLLVKGKVSDVLFTNYRVQ